MTTNYETILACYEQNLRNARTPAMREFVTERIAAYKKTMADRARREATTGPTWDREIEGEE